MKPTTALKSLFLRKPVWSYWKWTTTVSPNQSLKAHKRRWILFLTVPKRSLFFTEHLNTETSLMIFTISSWISLMHAFKERLTTWAIHFTWNWFVSTNTPRAISDDAERSYTMSETMSVALSIVIERTEPAIFRSMMVWRKRYLATLDVHAIGNRWNDINVKINSSCYWSNVQLHPCMLCRPEKSTHQLSTKELHVFSQLFSSWHIFDDHRYPKFFCSALHNYAPWVYYSNMSTDEEKCYFPPPRKAAVQWLFSEEVAIPVSFGGAQRVSISVWATRFPSAQNRFQVESCELLLCVRRWFWRTEVLLLTLKHVILNRGFS